MMATFGHDHQEHTIGPQTGRIMNRLTDFSGRWVAHDEDVFTAANIHAGVNDGSCTPCHFFLETDVFLFALGNGFR